MCCTVGMKSITALVPAFVLGSLAVAAAQTPVPANWTNARLSTATYVILDPQMLGPSLLGGGDQTSVLDAMRRDSGNALKRRYPGAAISEDAGNPQAIRVTPVLVTPSALLPWLKLTARLEFALPEGNRVIVGQDFGLLTVWQHQSEAANFVYDQLAQRLP